VKINQVTGVVYGNSDPDELDDAQKKENLICELIHSYANLKGMIKGLTMFF
jgi:hypothetical protein